MGTTGRSHYTFINVYSTEEQQIQQGNSVTFDTHSAIIGDCAHSPNTDEIMIWRTGYYNVHISIYTLEACQFSMFKNSTNLIVNSTIGSIIGSSQITTSFIMHITDSDIITKTTNSPFGVACKLQLINNIGFTPYITLIGSGSSGNSIPQITATMTIMFIK